MAAKVIFLMADYGHDPTETAIPWNVFKSVGCTVHFATEQGKAPACDKRMLEGITGTLLGAPAPAKEAYSELSKAPEFTSPLSWASSDFTLDDYDLVFLPGGHDKSIRQIIEHPKMNSLLASYFPKTLKPSRKSLAAICHGVQVLATATLPDGKSVLHDATTTALPGFFETSIFQSTRLFLGDYYKTYGAGSDNVEDVVKKSLDDPKQFVVSINPSAPLVVEDPKYNYLSGRFPLDAEPLAQKALELLESVLK